MLLSLWIYFNFGCYILGCLIWCWLPWLQLRTACFTIKFKTCKVDSLIRNVGAGTYANWSQQCLEKEGTNSQMNLVFDFRLKSCVIGSGSGQSSPKAINRPSKSSLVKGDLGICFILKMIYCMNYPTFILMGPFGLPCCYFSPVSTLITYICFINHRQVINSLSILWSLAGKI